jgi:hypothetical protein
VLLSVFLWVAFALRRRREMGADEFVGLDEARRLLSPGTIEAAVKSGDLPVYKAGIDRRRRLFLRRDVERVAAPRPIEPTRQGPDRTREETDDVPR